MNTPDYYEEEALEQDTKESPEQTPETLRADVEAIIDEITEVTKYPFPRIWEALSKPGPGYTDKCPEELKEYCPNQFGETLHSFLASDDFQRLCEAIYAPNTFADTTRLYNALGYAYQSIGSILDEYFAQGAPEAFALFSKLDVAIQKLMNIL